MPVDLDLRVSFESKTSDGRTVEEVVAEMIADAVAEATRNLRSSAPRGPTGRLQGGFRNYDTDTGGVLTNEVEYSAYAREFLGAPPTGVLAYYGVRDMVAKRLEERADEAAFAVLHEIMGPLKRVT